VKGNWRSTPGAWKTLASDSCDFPFLALTVELRALCPLLYHLSHTSSPFVCMLVLRQVSLTSLGWPQTHNPPTSTSRVAGIKGRHHAWLKQ
jgi:hypothetical protein